MKIDLQRAGMFVPRHHTVEIREGRGYRVICRRGGLWITQEGDTRDIVIGAGESFVIDNDGLTLVHATDDACVDLSRRACGQAWSVWRRILAACRGGASATRGNAQFSPAR